MLSTNSDLLSVNFCLHRAFLIVSRPEKRGTEANHIAAVRDTKFIIPAHSHREKRNIFILSPYGIIQGAHFVRKVGQKSLIVRIGQHGINPLTSSPSFSRNRSHASRASSGA